MSGQYAQTIGVTGNGASEKFTENLGEKPSMSQHFKNNGYFAARVSKIYHMRIPGDLMSAWDSEVLAFKSVKTNHKRRGIC